MKFGARLGSGPAGEGGEAAGSGEEEEGGRKARGQLGDAQTGAGPVEGGSCGQEGAAGSFLSPSPAVR